MERIIIWGRKITVNLLPGGGSDEEGEVGAEAVEHEIIKQ